MLVEKPLWTARIWEDGTFTFGYVPYSQREVDKFVEPVGYSEYQQELLRSCVEGFGLLGALERIKDNPGVYAPSKGLSPLGSSPVSKSHTPGEVVRRKGISTHGKRLVRNAALRLEREVGTRNLTFLTLTIPGIQEQGALAVCENWSEIVRVFQQRLKRMLVAKNLSGEMVGVTEVQEKRFAATNVVALHLHIVFQGRQFYKAWALNPKEVRAAWKAVISPYLPVTSGEFYWDAAENMQPVRSSASGYLGKYMSKGAKTVEAIYTAFPDIKLPACWYLCSNSLRSKVRKRVTYFTSKTFPMFECIITSERSSDDIQWLQPIDIAIDNSKLIRVGYVGRMSHSLLDTLRESLGKEPHLPLF